VTVPGRLYDAGEVAGMLGIQRRSLLRRVRRGRWPTADRRIGGRPCWWGSTVTAALDGQVVTSPKQRPS